MKINTVRELMEHMHINCYSSDEQAMMERMFEYGIEHNKVNICRRFNDGVRVGYTIFPGGKEIVGVSRLFRFPFDSNDFDEWIDKTMPEHLKKIYGVITDDEKELQEA